MPEGRLHDAGLAGTEGFATEQLLGSDRNKEVLIRAGLWKQSYWYRLKQRMQPPKLDGPEGNTWKALSAEHLPRGGDTQQCQSCRAPAPSSAICVTTTTSRTLCATDTCSTVLLWCTTLPSQLSHAHVMPSLIPIRVIAASNAQLGVLPMQVRPQAQRSRELST